MARRPSATEREYRKNRQRILSTIRRYEEKGYFVNLEVPRVPQRITEGSVRRLQRLDLRTIRDNTFTVDTSGEIRGGFFTGQRILRNNQANNLQDFFEREENTAFDLIDGEYEEGAVLEADIILSNFRSNLRAYDADLGITMVESFLDEAIARSGKVATANMIKQAEDDGVIIDRTSIYDLNRLRGVLSQMLSYLGDFPHLQDQLNDQIDSVTWEELN